MSMVETVARALCADFDEDWSVDGPRWMDAARAAIAAMPGLGWQDISTAPYETAVEIKAGHMTFEAMLVPNGSEDENGSCDQWCAIHEGEHPPCWSEGACWASNVDEVTSLQPEAWRPLPPAPKGD